ncbi:cell division protein FtsQ/DivIB [Promicromonospora sp. Marseille-Q5078]
MSTAMADRIAERTAMRRHRAWRRVVAWVLSLALVVGVAVAALWSPVLALEKADVTVSGADAYIDEGAVREIVEAPDGTPLPRLDTVSLREQVLGLRGVKDVRIARVWPHGLSVELAPRVPVAAVPDGDRLALLDSAGVRVATRDAAPKGLPQVDVPLDDALALQAALHVLAALPARLAAQVEHVSADTQDAVETELEDGTTVRWGGSSDLPLKVEAVRTLRKVDPDARTVDVSSPELPVTR